MWTSMKFCFVGLLWLERKTRLELATPTLARWCSTTELFPHSWQTRTSGLNHVAWFILHCLVFREHLLAFICLRSLESAFISYCIRQFLSSTFLKYFSSPALQAFLRKACWMYDAVFISDLYYITRFHRWCQPCFKKKITVWSENVIATFL